MKTMLLFLCFVAFAAASLNEDYCWRDYNGQIPSDAYPAGLDRNGNPIYIGQALLEVNLIPGKILHNDTNIYLEWAAAEVKKNNNVKIFCTEQPQKFVWTVADVNNLLKLANELPFINGGFEPGFFTFIGRVLTDGETTVGKVICQEGNCHGLLTTKNSRTRVHKTFQVLTHNPGAENVNKCLHINFY